MHRVYAMQIHNNIEPTINNCYYCRCSSWGHHKFRQILEHLLIMLIVSVSTCNLTCTIQNHTICSQYYGYCIYAIL